MFNARANIRVILVLLPRVNMILIKRRLLLIRKNISKICRRVLNGVRRLLRLPKTRIRRGARTKKSTLRVPGIKRENDRLGITRTLTTRLNTNRFRTTTLTGLTLVTSALMTTTITLPILNEPGGLLTRRTFPFQLRNTVISNLKLNRFAMKPTTGLIKEDRASFSKVGRVVLRRNIRPPLDSCHRRDHRQQREALPQYHHRHPSHPRHDHQVHSR